MDRLTPDEAVAAIGSLEDVRRSDRQATLEHLVAHVAHHLGSPLNVIEGRASMMVAGEVAEADMKRNSRIIAEQAARMVRFLREIVTFAQKDPGSEAGIRATDETTVDLGAVVRAAATMFRPMALAKHTRIALEDEGGAAPVRGCARTLLIALTHVLENGIRATPEGGTVTLRLLREQVPEEPREAQGPSPYFSVEIDDEGPGIDPDVLPRLFKPFTTTRDDRQALGLGLFVAQSIAKEHGGWLEGANKKGAGARFILHLPQGAADAQ